MDKFPLLAIGMLGGRLCDGHVMKALLHNFVVSVVYSFFFSVVTSSICSSHVWCDVESSLVED